jgi:predicted nucleic acid-binding protein
MAAIRSRSGASFALLSQLPAEKRAWLYGVSTALWLEYEAKLLQSGEADATPLSEAQLRAILAAISHFAEPVPIYFRLRPNLRNEGDNMVFECAAHFGAEMIVTHNLHDFATVEVRGYNVRAIRPGEFLKQFRQELL